MARRDQQVIVSVVRLGRTDVLHVRANHRQHAEKFHGLCLGRGFEGKAGEIYGGQWQGWVRRKVVEDPGEG